MTTDEEGILHQPVIFFNKILDKAGSWKREAGSYC
jgi:hypothetical protein